MDQEEVQTRWWHKLEPLASVFRKACLDSWLPSTHVAVDEMMIRCFGRSKHTYKMPNKPIAQGYKMFAICDGGYLLYFIWTSRSRKMTEVKQYKELAPTQSLVYRLCEFPPHSKDSDSRFIVYIDNYFNNIKLASALRKAGTGACGTTRPGEGIPPILTVLKEEYGKVYIFLLPFFVRFSRLT